jgi:hypothetical protein
MLVLALQFSRGNRKRGRRSGTLYELDADGSLPHNGRENRVDTNARCRRRTFDDIGYE